ISIRTAALRNGTFIRGRASRDFDRLRSSRPGESSYHRASSFRPVCRSNSKAIPTNEALSKLERELKRMMGKEAAFRGVQDEAIKAITAGMSPVVVVMPTGAGKSMLFMLPAWVEQGGTTVVVVPLIALRGDMTRRCKELGIPCAEWEGRRQPDAAAVVLVTPESAVGEDFMTFLNRLKATEQLDRIVIDECHIVLNRGYAFRKQMQQLGKLIMAETQMMLLTATLPPSEEEELYRRMYSKEQVKTFRVRTARKNAAYRVVDMSEIGRRGDKEEVVLGLIERQSRKYAVAKVMVYDNTVPVQEVVPILYANGTDQA
ncbi:hypothetical protein LTR66_017719, partial [Elasticomyces elasticus]